MSIVVAVTIVLLCSLVTIYFLISKRLETTYNLVNSNLEKLQADLELILKRIEALEAVLVEK